MSIQSSEQKAGVPRYMAQLLEELGWNQGSRIPLASPENQVAEELLVSRQNEIQRLKEAVATQNQKQKDLNNYKGQVQSEYDENTRLLFALKSQLEQEVKLRQVVHSELNANKTDLNSFQKQSKDICARIERFRKHIASRLKRCDALKSEVCGERVALQEWRAALERSSGDISSIEQFTKEDVAKAKQLEYKRQLLKVEHDRLHEHLHQLVSNLAAEERACERISVQVNEGLEQRKQMMSMWMASVEHLRLRDIDMKHMREDYAVLNREGALVAEQCREQQAFCDQQRGNNEDAFRANHRTAMHIGQVRQALQRQTDMNTTLESEIKSMQRVIENVQHNLERLRAENRQIMDDQRRKDNMLKELKEKMEKLKEKLAESLDKTRSADKRVKELESMLYEEERYASSLVHNQQRAMQCSYREQQKLLKVQNEEKLFNMQNKAAAAEMAKFDIKKANLERNIRTLKESIYKISYQAETVGAKVLWMEGAQAERELNSELVVKENRLKEVYARHAARVAMLEGHSAKLHDDMLRLAREIDAKRLQHEKLESKMKTSLLNVAGCKKDYQAQRKEWRRERVEEALMRLRVAHNTRSVAGSDDTAFSLQTQRLQLDAAMNERMVEIATRRDMFSVQRRALQEDCGKLRSEIRERQQRIDQLVKRYDIFINSLGKDESGQQVSVTYFKIKFAAEREELRMRGLALDRDIRRREKDVAALEATLRVIHAAHAHFMHKIQPLADDTPEIQELEELRKQYYELVDELKAVRAQLAELEERVNDAGATLTMLGDKNKQLMARESEAEVELDTNRERVSRQETRLANAQEVVQHYARRAKKLVGGVDDWRIFQMALWVRDYAEAAASALQALNEACTPTPELKHHLMALVSTTDIVSIIPRNQHRLISFVERLVADHQTDRKSTAVRPPETVFSSSAESVRSGVSQASGYTRRLAAFRRTMATKVQEPTLHEEIPEMARRSTVSLHVVTLGIEQAIPVSATSTIASKVRVSR